MEIEDYTPTKLLYSTSRVYVMEATNKISTIVVRVVRNNSGDTLPSTEIGQLLQSLAPNFVQIYGEVECSGNTFYFDYGRYTKDEQIKLLKQANISNADKLLPFCDKRRIVIDKYNTSNVVSLSYILMEKLSLTLDDIKKTISKQQYNFIVLSVLLQIAAALQIAQDRYNFEHNDLHKGNIRLRSSDIKELTYNIRGKKYTIPIHGYIGVITDYEYARIITPSQDLIGEELQKIYTHTDSRNLLQGEGLQHLPLSSTAPLNTWQDISTLWYDLFEKEPTNMDMFFGVHGLKIQAINARPISIIKPLQPLDLLLFNQDSIKYLKEFVNKLTGSQGIRKLISIGSFVNNSIKDLIMKFM